MNNEKPKLDKTLSNLINFSSVILFFSIAILIYWYFFSGKKITQFECFDNPSITISSSITRTLNNEAKQLGNKSIYERSLSNVFRNFPRLICNLTPTPDSNLCDIDGEKYIKYNLPIHMLKLPDSTILAVFNDGRLYKKDTIQNTMWEGPLPNSLPNDTIPLRMITLTPNLKTLLGIGYDNILYMKTNTNETTNLFTNITSPWKRVSENTNIIYCLFDRETARMITITTTGQLQIKSSSDLNSNNIELVIPKLDRRLLRLYYDNNGYMLALDTNFDLYQFTELNWKNSGLNLSRGANSSKLHDILYDNDGKMYGLVFNTSANILQIMKQDTSYYLGNFLPLDIGFNSLETSNTNNGSFVLSDKDIINAKVGNIEEFTNQEMLNDIGDDDPNVAYQKMILETRADLKKFCSTRSNSSSNSNIDNYDLLSKVESNEDQIVSLKNIIENLILYEPDKARLIEKYPVINNITPSSR
jgi:hypothetical protein